MAPAARPKPTDATGVARAKELKKHEAELAARADEITTIAAAEAARADEVQDPLIEAAPDVVDEVQDPRIESTQAQVPEAQPEEAVVEVGKVDLADDTVVIRVIADITEMVYGYGNVYSFKAGVKYKVSKELANHLETLGYTYSL